jgi:hypothetical protein
MSVLGTFGKFGTPDEVKVVTTQPAQSKAVPAEAELEAHGGD